MSVLVGLNSSAPGKRQAITRGPVDALGLPNAITTTSGLNCQINASASIPISCNFAAGFRADGTPIEFSGSFESNQSYSGLAANAIHYFYLERNTSTGVVTPGRITIAPVYARIAPVSPTTGLHWFKTSQASLSTQPGMTMYEWSGSAWVARQRVFLGEVGTGASAVTSIANYSYDRRYKSPWFPVGAGGNFNVNHNLGMFPAEAEASFEFYARENSSDPYNYLVTPGFYAGGLEYGLFYAGAGTRISTILYAATQGWFSFGFGSWTIGEMTVSATSEW